MRRFSLGLVTLILMFGMLTPVSLGTSGGMDSNTVSVIVEMVEEPAIQQAQGNMIDRKKIGNEKVKINNRHKEFVKNVKANGMDISLKKSYTTYFNGFSLVMPKSQLKKLESLPGVKEVYMDTKMHISVDDSVPLIGADHVWQQMDSNGLSITGQGVTVAVIDSGIDYTHPDLGGGFGADFKVVDGYDFVNNDPDPMDDNGHGTHVAGTIGGNGTKKGVAPDVKLTAYKTMDRWGSGYTSDIIAALEHAADPENPNRADVINMSIGGPGDENHPLSKAANLVAMSGIVVVTSAGNSGPDYWTVGAPASAEHVISVGASFNQYRSPRIKMTAPFTRELNVYQKAFSADPPISETSFDLVDVGYGGTTDFENKDVSGKAILAISNFVDEEVARRAEAAGAKLVVFYESFFFNKNNPQTGLKDNESTLQHRILPSTVKGNILGIPVVEVSSSAGKMLANTLGEQPVQLSMDSIELTDQIVGFSSKGPTWSYRLKPDMVAPGAVIHSTLPTKDAESSDPSGYGPMSGTSMAAPHVAGAAALLKQLHPNWSESDIKSVLIGSSKKLEGFDPLTQGSGRLDVLSSVNSQVISDKVTISFGLANLSGSHIQTTVPVTLKNPTVNTVNLDLRVNHDSDLGGVFLGQNQLKLGPGESKIVEVSISMADPVKDYDILGWIEGSLTESGNSILSIPFYLPIRHLQITATPDPSFGETNIMVASPVPLNGAPTVKITGPSGEEKVIAVENIGENTWQARTTEQTQGIHQIHVEGVASEHNQIVLRGQSSFEVVESEKESNGISSWQEVGPNSIGGKLVINPSKPKQWIVLDQETFYNPGMFITDNEGSTWTELRNVPVGAGEMKALVFEPYRGKKMYVAVNSGYMDATYQGKIFTSKDGGQTWSNTAFPNVPIQDLKFSGDGQAIVAVTDYNGVWVSTDEGGTWRQLSGELYGVTDTFVLENDLLIATWSGLYLAKNIHETNFSLEKLSDVNGEIIKSLTGNGEKLFAGTYNGVYSSDDGGITWAKQFEPMEYFSTFYTLRLIGNDLYGYSSNGYWIGKNYGETWEELASPSDHSYGTDFVQVKGPGKSGKDEILVTTEFNGIFKTNNPGKNATYTRIGIPAANVHDIAVTKNSDGNEKLLAGTLFEVLGTMNHTNEKIDSDVFEWGQNQAEGSLGSEINFLETHPQDDRIIFKVKTSSQGSFYIYKSLDAGESWMELTQGREYPFSFLIHPADPNKIYVSYFSFGGNGILYTEDGGETWRNVPRPSPSFAMAGDPNDANKIWFGGLDGLYVSRNNGVDMKQLSQVFVNDISVHPVDSDNLVIGGSELYYSTDGGKTLTKSEYTNIPMNVNDILSSPSNPDILYAATGYHYELGMVKNGRGVLRSLDGGKTWSSFSKGLRNKNVNTLELSRDERYLFAGTVGGGVHRIKLVPSVNPPILSN
jgi:subtilisin family serine protease/photosystem II stability/assembly factor-like uncharacterized protein